MRLAILGFVVSILCWACTSSRPIYQSVSEPDYNNRILVNNPEWQKKINPVGVVATVGMATAGAYAGYENSPVRFSAEEGEIDQGSKVGNAILGAMVGYGVASLGNYIISRKGEIRLVKDERKEHELWVRKYDKEQKLLEADNYGYELIHENAYIKYTVQTLDDVKDYYKVFGNKPNRNKIFKQSVEVLKRNELPNLISLDDQNPYVHLAYKKYFNESSSVKELFAAQRRYSHFDYPVERRAIQLINEYEDLQLFVENFPNSSGFKSAFKNGLKGPVWSKEEVKRIVKKHGGPIDLSKRDMANTSSQQKKNYLYYLARLHDDISFIELIRILKDYKWLEYDNITEDYLSIIWNNQYPEFEDGNKLVGAMYFLEEWEHTDFLGLKEKEIEDFLKKKLEEEANENIEIVYAEVRNNRNWTYNEHGGLYDAPVVTEEGELIFMYYGKVVNYSKFDLPVRLEIDADLVMEGEGGLFGLNPIRAKKKLEGIDKEYYIPLLRSGEDSPFAVLYELDGLTGISINFLISAKTKQKVEGFEVSGHFMENMPSQATLNRQKRCLEHVRDGFKNQSTVNAIGIFGKEEYDPEDYDIDWDTDYNTSSDVDKGYRILEGNEFTYVEVDNDWPGAGVRIRIIDGGTLFSNVCNDYYVKYVDKWGNEEIKRDPFDDAKVFSEDFLPIMVKIYYRDSSCTGEHESLKVEVYESGDYIIDIE